MTGEAPRTEAGRRYLADPFNEGSEYAHNPHDIVRAIEDEAFALMREVAAAGVVHEAEPPGIDYVTVQIDMDTWAALKRWASGSPTGGEE